MMSVFSSDGSLAAVSLVAGVLAVVNGCSSAGDAGARARDRDGTGGGGEAIATGGGGGQTTTIINPAPTTTDGGAPCEGGGWLCAIDECAGRPKTTVRAKVYDPAGKNPLYNAVVYVNNTPVDPITSGAKCEPCITATGSPIAAAITDATGEFTMADVPVGTGVPMVIQIGKWRREIRLPEVKPCQENVFDDPQAFRLPRSQAEGNLPKIAMTTGEADTLECLLRRIGIADEEFTDPRGSGRVNLFSDLGGSASYSSGGVFPPYTQLSASAASFMAYDVVIMNCTGSQADGQKYTTAQKQALKDYVDGGGRAFLEHYHHAWLRGGTEDAAIEKARKYQPTPFPSVATWVSPWSVSLDNGFGGTTHDFFVDTTFQRGSDMADWLQTTGATTTRATIGLYDVKNPALSVMPGSQRWIYDDNAHPENASLSPALPTSAVPYFSVNMPIGTATEAGATPLCGRLVHTGIHVAGVAQESNGPFPAECKVADLTPQEKAMEFMLFDLSSCVTPNNERTTVDDITIK